MAQEEGSSAWTFVFEGNPSNSTTIEPLPLQKTPTPPAQIQISSPKLAIQKKKTVQKTNINQTKWKFMGSRSKIHKVGVHFDKHSQYLGNWKGADGNPSSVPPSSPTSGQPIATAPVNLLTRTKKQIEKNILQTAHSPFKSFPTSRYSLPDISGDDDSYPNTNNNNNHNQHQLTNVHRNHHNTSNNSNNSNSINTQLSLEDEPLTLKCYNSEPIYQPLSVQRSSSVDSPFLNFHNPYEQTQLAPSTFSSEHLNLITHDGGNQLNLNAFSNSINSINNSLNFPPTQYSAPVPLQRSFSHNSPLQLQTTSLQLVQQQQQSIPHQSQLPPQQQQPQSQQSMVGQLHPSLLHLQSTHSSQPSYQPLVLNLDNFEQGAHLLHTEYYNHYQM